MTAVATSDAASPPLDPLDDASALAMAWQLKDRCYASWSSDPPASVEAAQALDRLRRQLTTDTGSDTLCEVDALVAWTAGIARAVRGDMAAAVGCFDEAAARFAQLDQPLRAAQTQVPKIMALTMLGQHDAAGRCADDTQSMLLEHGDVHTASKVALNQGSTLLRSGHHAQAVPYFEKASAWFSSLEDREHCAMADLGLGDAYAALGQPLAAARIYERALRQAQSHGFRVLQAIAEESLALLDLARGRFREALAGLEQAHRRYAELDMPQHLAIMEMHLAETYLDLRLLPEALSGLAAAIARFDSLSMQVDRAWALLYQGRAWALAGQLAAATASFELGATLFEQQANARGSAAMALARAELALLRGDAQEAHRLSRLAARDFDAAGLEARRLRADVVTAQALLVLQDPVTARRLFDAALEAARGHDLLPLQMHCLAGRAMAARATGDLDAARADLEAAAALFDDMGRTLPDDEVRSAYQSDHLLVFRELLRMALDDCARAMDHPTSVAVLVQLERFRARVLADRLAGSAASGDAADHPSRTAATDGDGPEARLAWLHRRARRLQDDLGAAATLAQQIRLTERELIERSRRARVSSSAQAPSADLPFDIRALHKRLRPGDALVEYGVLDDELFAIVVGSGGVAIRRHLASWQRVLQVVRWTRFQLQSPRYGAAATQRHAKSLLHRAEQRLGELYGLIWAPLEAALRGKGRVLVVPHAQLGAIPFAALGNGYECLVDRHEIAIAPSARIALRGLGRAPRRVHSVLALGESSRLPHAAQEATAVASMLPDGLACVGDKATAQALIRHGQRVDVIHLACHAQFRADNPMFSSVHLHDGPLSAQAIESLRLRSAIVVLSACETALHAEHGGDEIFGITRAFLVAGAERVVASLCTVDDAATAQMMRAFYAALKDGRTPGAALRAAQRSARAQAEHPYYWAAFTLIGGW